MRTQEQLALNPPGVVAAAHPLAAETGVEILEAGGNAIDAAVATAFALNVVEPFASGIGGGGFLLYYDAVTGKVSVRDFREKAPADLSPHHYRVKGVSESSTMHSGGMAVAVPGMARGLLAMHAEHGRLSRERVLGPAIKHAESGFEVSPTLAGILASKADLLKKDKTASSIFLVDGGAPYKPGDILVQRDLSATLRAIAIQGESAVYGPDMAHHIADAVRVRGGILKASDITGYSFVDREPVPGSYRGYDLVTIGPPSSGGLTLLMTLSVLDRFDVQKMSPEDPVYLALFAEAFAAAQTACDRVVADPSFAGTGTQTSKLLSDAWIDRTVADIRSRLGNALAGAPVAGRAEIAKVSSDLSRFPGNTTHFSVIDADGNMVALTQTINYWFGSGVVVPGTGIVLNNEMYDFSFEEGSVNLPEPGKRPRSSISPLIILQDGKPVAAIGTPGGRRIPSALAQIVVRCIDFDQDLQSAIDAPRVHINGSDHVFSHESRIPTETIRKVAGILGEEWSFRERNAMDAYFGGAQGIWLGRDSDKPVSVYGGADPRRDGAVARVGH